MASAQAPRTPKKKKTKNPLLELSPGRKHRIGNLSDAEMAMLLYRFFKKRPDEIKKDDEKGEMWNTLKKIFFAINRTLVQIKTNRLHRALEVNIDDNNERMWLYEHMKKKFLNAQSVHELHKMAMQAGDEIKDYYEGSIKPWRDFDFVSPAAAAASPEAAAASPAAAAASPAAAAASPAAAAASPEAAAAAPKTLQKNTGGRKTRKRRKTKKKLRNKRKTKSLFKKKRRKRRIKRKSKKRSKYSRRKK